MQAVLEEVQSSMESTHEIESYAFGNFSHQVRHTLRRRARLMEPVGASSFSEKSGAAFSTHTCIAEWPNSGSVSSQVRLVPHFLFDHPTKPLVLRGQNQDALRSTPWRPATLQNLRGKKPPTGHRSIFRQDLHAEANEGGGAGTGPGILFDLLSIPVF